MATVEAISLRDVAIGRVKHEGIVKIDWRLEWHDRPAATIEHESINGHWQFGVSGSVWLRSNSPDCHSAGQIIDYARQVGTPLARRIVKVWEEWHLNDLQQACAHMPAGSLYQTDSTITCPETGYRIGSAWLVRPLTDDALAEIRAIGDELRDI
jgi:hypothetical protein